MTEILLWVRCHTSCHGTHAQDRGDGWQLRLKGTPSFAKACDMRRKAFHPYHFQFSHIALKSDVYETFWELQFLSSNAATLFPKGFVQQTICHMSHLQNLSSVTNVTCWKLLDICATHSNGGTAAKVRHIRVPGEKRRTTGGPKTMLEIFQWIRVLRDKWSRM